MGAMEDAGARISSARVALERSDYVNALSEASLCVELTAKAFLGLCKVSYEMEEKGRKGRLMHDVSSKIPDLFLIVKADLTNRGKVTDIRRYAKIFGRLAIMNRIVWSVGEQVDFGIREMDLGATDLVSFDVSELVKALVARQQIFVGRLKSVIDGVQLGGLLGGECGTLEGGY